MAYTAADRAAVEMANWSLIAGIRKVQISLDDKLNTPTTIVRENKPNTLIAL
jgi:hypothetical protein